MQNNEPIPEIVLPQHVLVERIKNLEQEKKEADESYEAVWKKFEDCPHKPINSTPGIGVVDLCGCSLDRIGDVCAVHAPALRGAQKRIAALEAQVRQLRETVKAAIGLATIGEVPAEVTLQRWDAALSATEPK
jgi:hypothetical protein